MNYKIIHTNGHYEAYVNGVFVCSGDTATEAAIEVEKYLEERK